MATQKRICPFWSDSFLIFWWKFTISHNFASLSDLRNKAISELSPFTMISRYTNWPNTADPGIFVRGGPKKLWQLFFFFIVLSLFYRSQMVNLKEIWNLSFFKGPEGVKHFPGGVQLFPGGGGGSNWLFPIETHITCDFPGGSGPPVPPSGSALA